MNRTAIGARPFLVTPPEQTGEMKTDSIASAADLVSRTEDRRVRESADREATQRGQLGQFFTPAPVAALLAGMFDVPTVVVRLLDPGAGVGSLTAALVGRACTEEWPVTLVPGLAET